MLVTSSFA